MKNIPKISIITPSYNQGIFIEETILSVIGQNYPNLEYIIIDGGSTDDTVEIIKKYEKHLHYWISEKDGGQSNAINKGFEIASGDILAWLNSDDIYLPGTLSHIAGLVDIGEPGIYFGNCIHFRETDNGVISSGSNLVGAHKYNNLNYTDYIIQPSTFWTKQAWGKAGKLREDLHFGFDWEWFLRAKQLAIPFYPLSKCLSMYRFHDAHKTGTGGNRRQQELCTIYYMYDTTAADLYRKLIKESLSLKSYKNRLLIWSLKLFKQPHTYADVLKIRKPKMYGAFSVKEITETKYMT